MLVYQGNGVDVVPPAFNFLKNETTSQVFFVCKFGMFFQPTTLLKMRRPTPEQLFFC